MTNALVCIVNKETAQNLIEFGNKFIKSENDKLYLLHLESYETYYINNKEEENLDYLYELALIFGADIKILRSNNMARSITNFIKENNISQVVAEDSRATAMLKRIKLEDVEFHFLKDEN